MKHALISSIESVESGYRVAQVVPHGETFPVAPGLFWTVCDDSVVADHFWYDPVDETFKPTPGF